MKTNFVVLLWHMCCRISQVSFLASADWYDISCTSAFGGLWPSLHPFARNQIKEWKVSHPTNFLQVLVLTFRDVLILGDPFPFHFQVLIMVCVFQNVVVITVQCFCLHDQLTAVYRFRCLYAQV